MGHLQGNMPVVLDNLSKPELLRAHNWQFKNHLKFDFWQSKYLPATKFVGKNDLVHLVTNFVKKHPFLSPWLEKQWGVILIANLGVHVYMHTCSSLVRFSLFGSPLKSWSPITSNFGSRMQKRSFICYEVKGHVPRSRVIWGQVRWKMLVFVTWVSFEKLKFDWNQTWFKDAVGFLNLYVNEIKGHVLRCQGSTEVKLGGKCKIDILFSCEPLTRWVGGA